MVSVTKHNMPALRFDGFDGEWVTNELNDLVEVGNGRDYKHLDEGCIPVYGTGGYMLSVDQALSYSEDAIGIGRKGTIDKPYLLRAPFWTVDTLFFVMARSGIDLPFLFSVFQRVDWKSKNTATGVPSLTSQAIERTTVTISSSLGEQRAIGELFADLDALIEQHRAKHANLQQTKTALMQRMFPQDGADEPELRLDGFSNPWVLRHLGEFEITTGPFGSTLHAEDYVEYGTPIVTTEHFKSGLLPLTGQGLPQVSDDDLHRLKAYWLQTDDIVFSRVGSVDINARVTELQNGWLFSGRVLRVRPDATCESEFLHSVLETDSVRGSIRKRAVGMSMPSINTAILANTSFYQPLTLEEQRAIGEVFSNLDALIAAESHYITQLTQAKTALLQRMFV